MRVFTEVSVTLKGDETAARRNIPLARTLLGIMKSVNTKTNAVQRWRRTLPDGTKVDLASFHGRDYIQIEIPAESREDLLGGISYQTLEDAYRIVLPELFVDIVDYSQNKRAIYVRKDTPSWDEQANSYLSGGNTSLPTDRNIVGVIQADEDGIEHVFAVFKTGTTFNLEYYRRTPPSPGLALTTTYTINQDDEYTFTYGGLSPEVATKFDVDTSEILPAFTYNLTRTEAYCILACKPSNPEDGCGVVTVVLKLSIGTGSMVVSEHLKGGHIFTMEHLFEGSGEVNIILFTNEDLKHLIPEAGTYNGDLTVGELASILKTTVSGVVYLDLGISEEGTLLLTEVEISGSEIQKNLYSSDNVAYTLAPDTRPALSGYAMATGYTGSTATIYPSAEAVADAFIAASSGTWVKGGQSAGPGSASGIYIGGAATIIYNIERTDVDPSQFVNLPIYEVYVAPSEYYVYNDGGTLFHEAKEASYQGDGSAGQAVQGILIADGPFYSLENVPNEYVDTNQVVTSTYESNITAELRLGGQTIEFSNFAFGPLIVGAYQLIQDKSVFFGTEAQLAAGQRNPSMGIGAMDKTIHTWSIPFNPYQATPGPNNATTTLTFQRTEGSVAETISIESIDSENSSALLFKETIGALEADENPFVYPDPEITEFGTSNMIAPSPDNLYPNTSYRIAFDTNNSSTFNDSVSGYNSFFDFGLTNGNKSLPKRCFPLRADVPLLGGSDPLITASYSAVYERLGIAFYKSTSFASWRQGDNRAALFRDTNMDPITTYIYRDGVFEVDPFPEETILEPLRAHYV